MRSRAETSLRKVLTISRLVWTGKERTLGPTARILTVFRRRYARTKPTKEDWINCPAVSHLPRDGTPVRPVYGQVPALLREGTCKTSRRLPYTNRSSYSRACRGRG